MTWQLWIALILGGAGLYAFATLSSKKKVLGIRRNIFVLVTLVIGVGLLWQGGILAGLGIPQFPTFTAGIGGNQDEVKSILPSGEICLTATSGTTVTLSSIDKFTQVATGGNHRYRIDNSPALTVSDAGTVTASPGNVISVLWGNASTTSNYYSLSDSFEVPCAPTYTRAAELYRNASLTIEVFNEEGNLIDTAGENETLAAGDVVTLPMNLKGVNQRGFPYGFVVAVEYNTTEIDDVIVDLGGKKVDTPGFYTVNSTAHTTKFYSSAAVISNQILKGAITIDVDDTVKPSYDDDIDIRVYPLNYFINEDTGGSYDGPAVEDEDDVRTSPDEFTFTLNID